MNVFIIMVEKHFKMTITTEKTLKHEIKRELALDNIPWQEMKIPKIFRISWVK